MTRRHLIEFSDMAGKQSAKEQILQDLRRRHAEGEDLSWTAMRQGTPKLVSAAEYHFGSYGRALREAGIDGALRVVHESWSREKVVADLRQLRAAGQDLSCSRMMEQQRRLFKAACAYFGNYATALEAAGIPPESVSRLVKVWTRQHVIQTLRDLYRQGEDLRFSRVQKRSPGFMQAVHKRFGTYKRAVLSAGLPYPPLNTSQWTERGLLQELRDRHARGEDLRRGRLTDPRLWAAARRYCGSWQAAVVKAGIDYDEMCRQSRRNDAAAGRPPLVHKQPTWTRERILAELHRLQDGGQAMNPRSMEDNKPGAALVQACIRQFGTYRKALAAAGIELAKPPVKKWQPQEILDGVREMYREGRRLSAYQAFKAAKRLYYTALKRFGSWANAMREAGVDPALMDPSGPDQCLQELLTRHEAGTDLSYDALRATEPLLLRAALKHFGSYRGAIEAAGLSYPADLDPCPLSADEVLQHLRQMHEAGSDIHYRPMKRSQLRVFRAALRHFGCYTNAVRQAGIDYSSLVRRPRLD